MNEQVAVLPPMSVALYMTVVDPRGKVSPEEKLGTERVALARSSVTVGSVQLTVASLTPASVGWVMSLGQPTMVGDWSSVGVWINTQDMQRIK